MTVQDMIDALVALGEEARSLEVETYSATFDRKPASYPKIAFRKILTGRQVKPAFWLTFDSPESKGEMVVMI